MGTLRVRVVGGGIIGLACAEELLRRGHHVHVLDPAPGSGASHAAAGMLGPAAEAWHGEPELARLGRASCELWPAFAHRLGVPLSETGTLLVGHDAGDAQRVRQQVELLGHEGEPAEPLDRGAALALEPTLSPRVAAAAVLPRDHSVDPRAVVAALQCRVGDALERVPGQARHDPAYDATVVATGSVLPEPFARLVRGVRGEVLRLRSDDPPRQVVRGWVRGTPVYAVPRPAPGGPAPHPGGSTEVVVGATSEEHDAPPVVTVAGVARLLEAARTLLPGLDRAELVEAIARDRPGTRDNRPLVGPTDEPGVVLAAGHFRHGVLLAPLTARLVADHLESGVVEPAWDPRREMTED